MTNQAIWIGIVIGVFFAGLGIGYAAFSMTPSTLMMGGNQRHQMMNQMISDPQTMTEFMNQMMTNPEAIQIMHETMIKDQNHMQKMRQFMTGNPQYMQQMMNDPEHMSLMHQIMFNDPQHMQQMLQMMNNATYGWSGPMVGQGMMNPGTMTGPMMMGTPITTQSDVLKTIDNIESLLDQVSAKYDNGDSAGALSTATEAYLENYEYIEGAVASKDPNLMEKVELMLRRDLRHAINTDQPTQEINSTIDSIKQELGNIRNLFQ